MNDCWFFVRHLFLMKVILTPATDKKYNKQFRQWFFFSDYARFQSSFNHLKNYSLTEHARWSIIVFALLCLWFRKEHLQLLFLHKFKQLLEIFSDKTAVDVIVKCFAAMIKNNNVCMTNDLAEDRTNFDVYVRNFRQQYQQFLMAATSTYDVNLRFRSKTSVEKNPNLDLFASAEINAINWTEFLTITQRQIQPIDFADNTAERSVRANQYRNDTKRLNVHADIHFDRIIAEYDLLNHCNVLINENKHKYFKKIVYYTNHSNIEKTMLFRKNLRQTIRLLLLDEFAITESKIIRLIKNIHQNCSFLFMTLLFRSEQMFFEQNDLDSRFSAIFENDHHLQSHAIDRLKSKYCQNILKLSTRSSKNMEVMSKNFKSALRYVYDKDYAIFNVLHFDIAVIQWCKKLAFTDSKTEHRITIKMNDFVKCRGSLSLKKRIDVLFIHIFESHKKRFFVKITFLQQKTLRVNDECFNISILKFQPIATNQYYFVDFPGIETEKLYMIFLNTIAQESSSQNVFWIKWTLQYLWNNWWLSNIRYIPFVSIDVLISINIFYAWNDSWSKYLKHINTVKTNGQSNHCAKMIYFHKYHFWIKTLSLIIIQAQMEILISCDDKYDWRSKGFSLSLFILFLFMLISICSWIFSFFFRFFFLHLPSLLPGHTHERWNTHEKWNTHERWNTHEKWNTRENGIHMKDGIHVKMKYTWKVKYIWKMG